MHRGKGAIFIWLHCLIAAGQMVVLAVLPLKAFRLLGEAQTVSLLYFAVGAAAMAGRLAIPWLCHRIGRARVFAHGCVGVALSSLLLASETVIGLAIGLLGSILTFSSLEIVLNQFLLERVPRGELSRFEPYRIFITAFPCTIGPALGVYLQHRIAPWAPYAISAVITAVLFGCFVATGLAGKEAPAQPQHKPLNPLLYYPRFFAQPRLRLSWFLAAGRNAWWGMFSVYGPIFMVTAGLGEQFGGLLVSLGLGGLFSAPLWGWLARVIGLRWVLLGSYAVTGLCTVTAATLMDAPWLGAAVLLMAAMGASAIDAGGNTLFLRAVHPYERGEMAAVFSSYRDIAQIVPPAVFAALLAAFELPAVFAAGAVMMLTLAAVTLFIPRRF